MASPALPDLIRQLTETLSRLPGIGPRSAERLALHLVQSPREEVRQLSEVLLRARERITACSACGALTESDPCAICADPRRDGALVCVVERPTDVLNVEKTGAFKGRFHVLGGKLSPIQGIGPEDLRIDALEARIASEGVREVILALPTDVEGDATSYYLGDRLRARGVRITRIAHGLPAGAGLDLADDLTLSRALEGRREM